MRSANCAAFADFPPRKNLCPDEETRSKPSRRNGESTPIAADAPASGFSVEKNSRENRRATRSCELAVVEKTSHSGLVIRLSPPPP
ncbi:MULTISPECIES: hypothetical protein [Lysobacter]|uniref:Uncharacterized protein n=1 Tax=Lysobacter firmicutimachus TaxID=1792846 RepID=A0ABU8CZM7_9GAMM|nr:hypothetical protein [Lysobacter antibioticus]